MRNPWRKEVELTSDTQYIREMLLEQKVIFTLMQLLY